MQLVRGGVLEDTLSLEDVLKDTFWCPWPWPQRSSPWPQVLENCPALSSRTALFFELLKFCRSPEKVLLKTFYFGENLKFFFEDLFFLENTCACVRGPWPHAFLSLASRGSVLGRAVLGLGLGFFFVLGLEPCVLDSTSATSVIILERFTSIVWVSN